MDRHKELLVGWLSDGEATRMGARGHTDVPASYPAAERIEAPDAAAAG